MSATTSPTATESKPSRTMSPDVSAMGDTARAAAQSAAAKEFPPLPLPAAAFHRWITAVACVTFDLTLGPSMECVYPRHQLTSDEQTNVCSLSFPDSHCALLGDSTFCFRMRTQTDRAERLAKQQRQEEERERRNGDQSTASAPTSPMATGAESEPTSPSSADSAVLPVTEPTLGKHARSHQKYVNDNQALLFGYVLFRQKRDESNARGFFQKSVVLLSPLPAVELFSAIVKVIGQAFFDFGIGVLEVAAQQIATWPSPYPGRKVSLPLLGSTINEQLPHYSPLSPLSGGKFSFAAASASAFSTAQAALNAAGSGPASGASAAAASILSTLTAASTAMLSPFGFSNSPSGNTTTAIGADASPRTPTTATERTRSASSSVNSSPASIRPMTRTNNSTRKSPSPSPHRLSPAFNSQSHKHSASAGSELNSPTSLSDSPVLNASVVSTTLSSPSFGSSTSDSPLAKPTLVHSVSDSSGILKKLSLSSATSTGTQKAFITRPAPTLQLNNVSPLAHAASTAAASSSSNANNSNNSSTTLSGLMSPPSPTLSISQLFASVHSNGQGWFQGVNLYSEFGRSNVSNLWYCWELVLTAEPMLVVAKSPASCSQIVLGLVGLISPVVYKGDYRPYFTIYDPDFKYYSQAHDLNKLTSVILGVTNPFFLKAMEKFPHILCFGEENMADGKSKSSGKAHDGYDSDSGATGGGLRSGATGTAGAAVPHTKITSKFSSNIDQLHITSSPSQFVSTGTPLLLPDEATLKRLVDVKPSGTTAAAAASAKPSTYVEAEQNALAAQQQASASATSDAANFRSDINTAVLRRYFHHLTELFLAPFAPYVTFTPELQQSYAEREMWNPYANPVVTVHISPPTSTILQQHATQINASGFGGPPALPRFVEDEFLSRVIGSLSSAQLALFPLAGSTKSSRRARLQTLYARFIHSANFAPWFHESRERAQAQILAMSHQMIRQLSAQPNPDARFFRLLDGIRVSEAMEMAKRAQQMCWDESLNTLRTAAAAPPTTIDVNTNSDTGSLISTLHHHISHHLELIKSVLPKAQLEKFALWKLERASMLTDSKKKRLNAAAAALASSSSTSNQASPVAANTNSAPPTRTAYPPPHSGQPTRSASMSSSSSSSQSIQLPHHHPAAHSQSQQQQRSNGVSLTDRAGGSTVSVSSSEQRRAEIVAVPKDPLQLSISENYF